MAFTNLSDKSDMSDRSDMSDWSDWSDWSEGLDFGRVGGVNRMVGWVARY